MPLDSRIWCCYSKDDSIHCIVEKTTRTSRTTYHVCHGGMGVLVQKGCLCDFLYLLHIIFFIKLGVLDVIYVIEIKSTPCKSYYQDSQFYIAIFLHPSDNTFALDIRIGYPYCGSRHILLFLLINQTSTGIPFETLCIFWPIGAFVQPVLLASIPTYPIARRYYQELWATSKPTPCFPVIIK